MSMTPDTIKALAERLREQAKNVVWQETSKLLNEAADLLDRLATQQSEDGVRNDSERGSTCIEGSVANESVPLSSTSLKSTQGPFHIERTDCDDGAIVYELWAAPKYELVLSISDAFNARAKADIELICKLLNNQRPE